MKGATVYLHKTHTRHTIHVHVTITPWVPCSGTQVDPVCMRPGGHLHRLFMHIAPPLHSEPGRHDPPTYDDESTMAVLAQAQVHGCAVT